MPLTRPRLARRPRAPRLRRPRDREVRRPDCGYPCRARAAGRRPNRPSPSACSPATAARWRARSRSSRTTTRAGWELVREVYPHTGRAAIVGLTGAPGAGKSTLIGALTKLRREQGRTLAVLSIDPSSPFTHGALLGDRIRLTDHFLDPGVFIRSMANRGALGGLSEAALQAALLMDAAGHRTTSSSRPSASGRPRSTSSTTPTPSCSC